jgi:hypothetical protein
MKKSGDIKNERNKSKEYYSSNSAFVQLKGQQK